MYIDLNVYMCTHPPTPTPTHNISMHTHAHMHAWEHKWTRETASQTMLCCTAACSRPPSTWISVSPWKKTTDTQSHTNRQVHASASPIK